MEKNQWIEKKIVGLHDLVHKVNGWKLSGKKIVFTNGCFDILHFGHVDYLSKAANLGDKLIIGVNTDASVRRLKGDTRPINSEYDRSFLLAALLVTDAVCLFDEDTPENLIAFVRPDVLVKGGDYTEKTVVGGSVVNSYGGKVAIIPFVEGYSTTNLINQLKTG